MSTDNNDPAELQASPLPTVSVSAPASGQAAWKPPRLRTSRACDRCKTRKIRCSGTLPCETCVRIGTGCAYAAPYSRGRKPPPPLRNVDGGSRDRLPQVTNEENGQHYGRLELDTEHAHFPEVSSRPDDMSREESRDSPDPVTDQQGHYIGPASGVSFLARVRKRLHQSNLPSSSFTFGDVALPDYDPVPSVMMPQEETVRLVQRFFEFTMPIDRFFCPSRVEEWRREFCESMGSMRNVEDGAAKRAALWMIFAMAQEHLPTNAEDMDDDKSVRYFLAADYHLSKARGTVSIITLQARLCQCFWLLSRSRVNHCWELFGTTARLALVLGLHRKQCPSHPAGSLLDLDCHRRTFWSTYCLDNHLSVTFGRPKAFHDDDIDQELPSGVDDENLIAGYQTPQPEAHHYSIMLAPVAYYKLHHIVSLILRDLYSIRPLSIQTQCALAMQYSKMVQEWRGTLPSFLSLDTPECIPLIAIFQRQRDVLNVSYWHALIIIYRPLLLRKFALVQRGRDDPSPDLGIESSIIECLAAALRITEKVEEMFKSRMMFRSFWGTCYYGFTAAVVLYVYAILVGPIAGLDEYQTYLDAATHCQEKLASIAPSDSLVARYCLVLEELRREALVRTEPETGLQHAAHDLTPASSETMFVENMNAILYAPVMYQDVYGSAVDLQQIGEDGPAQAFPYWPQSQNFDNSGLI
ncbi:fungal-specific transcription factor domain-containing protein [Aspergillus carlsbadensis]|nr:fungal-specific transcription factor domain-containing protein [Aspergillus carlsbadensis]